MVQLPREILDECAVLFHDVRPEAIDADTHAMFVIARVLDRGSVSSVRALVHHYGVEGLRAFFRGGGAAKLSRRTLPLWAAYLNLTPAECTPTSSPRRSSPFWTD